MSNTSERPQGDNVLEALYASRRARAEAPRPAAVNEQAVARAPRLESVRPVVPLHERLQNPYGESAQGGIDSEVAPEPDDFNSDGVRRKVVAGVIGVAATVAVASVVALLLVNIFPKDRDADQALAATAPPQARHVSEPAKVNETAKGAPLSQVRAPVAASDAAPTANHEQSERLLQQFMQWRQKSPSSDKP
jgi:hypothetical protein